MTKYRSEEEVVKARDELLTILQECRRNADILGRSEALRSSDRITASLAAAQIDAFQYVLGELTSPMMRSSLLKPKR